MSSKRKRSGAEVQQKGKDGKRKRGFHRGRAQGIINDRVLRQVVEPAFAAAAVDREEGAARAVQARGQLRDHQQLLDGLGRVSPCVGLSVPDPLF